VRLCRFNRRWRSVPGLTRPLSISAEIADMKKPTLRIEEPKPNDNRRAAFNTGWLVMLAFAFLSARKSWRPPTEAPLKCGQFAD
jgi:hypothetical protein